VYLCVADVHSSVNVVEGFILRLSKTYHYTLVFVNYCPLLIELLVLVAGIGISFCVLGSSVGWQLKRRAVIDI
jgi:hypothetical protein